MIKRQIIAIFWGDDVVISALTGGAPGETISARCGKGAAEGSWFWSGFAWGVDKMFGKGHCAGAWLAYQERVKAGGSYGS
jgi:hypothetical protein